MISLILFISGIMVILMSLWSCRKKVHRWRKNAWKDNYS